MLNQKMMAFWPYYGSSPKHFLWGTVSETTSKGYVDTVEYGTGYWIKPLAILPLEAGLELKKKLETIEARHKKELAALRSQQLSEVEYIVKNILPFDKK